MIITRDDLELELFGSFRPLPQAPEPTRHDLYSLFLSRATSMHWSEAVSAHPEVQHPLWGMADAIAEPGPGGLIAWFHVVPLDGAQILPIQALIQCAVDSLRRLGTVSLSGLRLGLPLDIHHPVGAVVTTTKTWFAAPMAAPPVTVQVDVTADDDDREAPARRALAMELGSRDIAPFRVERGGTGEAASGAIPDCETVFVDAPEWSAESAAWIVAATADAAVRQGRRRHVVVRVAVVGSGSEPDEPRP